MRLNTLQRVGLVLSLLWAIGAAIYSYNADVKRATDFGDFSFRVCSHSPAAVQSKDLSQCNAERQKNVRLFMEGGTGNAVFLALVPIPFFWLAAVCLLYFARAQIAGFRAVIPWITLSKWKRAFVVFCAVSSITALLAVAVVGMNWYTDRQVPVSLGMPAMVTAVQDGSFVQAEGTWMRTDLTGDTIASPLQTSQIFCTKEENRCTEATAEVSGGALMTESTDHTVVSWTPASIIMRDELPCATTTYVIDLNTKKVTGSGHRTNDDHENCKMMSTDSGKEWSLLLSDGFPVYWNLRQKARPLPLRVIQTLLGN